mmetsp:Transcript_29431/g.113920  ORF Transcript_29431/g.113920 Transcript_29431/m.113920 type:complete len:126 (-) Transcript_29431:113-490(-)
MEVYMMAAFQSSFKGRINSYEAKVVAYQENAINILFHDLKESSSGSKYYATARVNASTGEATLVNGVRAYTMPEQSVVPNLASGDEGISPRLVAKEFTYPFAYDAFVPSKAKCICYSHLSTINVF